MVTVRRHMSEVMAEQICKDIDNHYHPEQQRAEWLAAHLRTHPETVVALAAHDAYRHPVWVSPDGAERAPVRYQTNRDAAIRRVARQIIKANGMLRFGFGMSSASVTPERYLRLRGYRLLPDDLSDEAQS